MISTFGNTKTLKSIYISIYGFNILANTSQTLTGYSFQSIFKGAYLYVNKYLVNRPILQRRLYVCAWASLASSTKELPLQLRGSAGGIQHEVI